MCLHVCFLAFSFVLCGYFLQSITFLNAMGPKNNYRDLEYAATACAFGAILGALLSIVFVGSLGLPLGPVGRGLFNSIHSNCDFHLFIFIFAGNIDPSVAAPSIIASLQSAAITGTLIGTTLAVGATFGAITAASVACSK